jgi:hypothetical protein
VIVLLSVCPYVYPRIVARQRLGKHVPAETNYSRIKGIIVGRVVFYAVRVVSKENRRLISSVKNVLINIQIIFAHEKRNNFDNPKWRRFGVSF